MSNELTVASEDQTPTQELAVATQEEPTQKVEVARAAEQPAATPTRDITLRIPLDVPDEFVATAWEMGQRVMGNVMAGRLIQVFPITVKGQDGQDQPAIGNSVVLILDEKDVKRMIDIGRKISQINMDTIKRVQTADPLGRATAASSGGIMKDNALRDAQAQAEGLAGGIQQVTRG